jgi:dienelactone hydrolase
LAAAANPSPAGEVVQFHSPALGADIPGSVLGPSSGASPGAVVPVVVYLKNLAIPRLGQEADEPIIADLRAQGYLVLVLDYGKNAKACSPLLNADMLELRQEIGAKPRTLLANYPVDANHVFILVEGYRLKRDVVFATDGPRTLAMDIQYPSKPLHAVPALMEITCDNANRMSCFSLLFCHDTLTDGGMAAGFAVAMIDHPVKPPYKGIDDPEPQVINRLKAAVRTLRWMAPQLGFSDKVGAMGFSRGGPMAALLAVTGNRPDLEGQGLHPDISSNVQAALIHGGRYDYSKLDSDDSMVKRFVKVWGPRDQNADKWDAHGAAKYLTKDAAPMFLNTSNAESKEYRDQISLFSDELTTLGVDHVYQIDNDGRGHHVSTDPKTLAAIYAFFHKHLDN